MLSENWCKVIICSSYMNMALYNLNIISFSLSKSIIPLGLSVLLHKSYMHPAVLICAANLLLPWLVYYFACPQGKVLFHSFHSWQYCSARKCRSSCGLSRERAGICCPGMALAHIPLLWDRGRCSSKISLQNVVSNAGKTVVYLPFWEVIWKHLTTFS